MTSRPAACRIRREITVRVVSAWTALPIVIESGGMIPMKKYVCEVCGYVYDEALGDPDNGIAPGTPWEDVPEDFVCPLCGVGKDQFAEE